jgi:hypothetical protein
VFEPTIRRAAHPIVRTGSKIDIERTIDPSARQIVRLDTPEQVHLPARPGRDLPAINLQSIICDERSVLT